MPQNLKADHTVQSLAEDGDPEETGNPISSDRSIRGAQTISARVTANKKNLLLLLQLRWLAVVGQVVTIAVVNFWLGIDLPLMQMGGVVFFLVCLNAVTLLRLRRRQDISNAELFIELLLDVAALTVQLHLSGGASNPFVSLYLLQVIIGAVLLEAWLAWVLVLIASGCFIWLTVNFRPIALLQQQDGDPFNLHIQGMFISFVLAATLLVFFIMLMNRNLRDRDAHLAALRQQSAEEDHIVRMGLLASGAAHDLGTPLATLSVIVNDWRRMPMFNSDPETLRDLEEMQTQLGRCKSIVSGILMSCGEARGEGTVRTTVNTFIDDLVADWRSNRSPTALHYTNMFSPDEAIVSDPALKQVISNVFDNAFEASPASVTVVATREDDKLVISVSDAGPGFEPDILAQLGKPYMSSKQRPGGGIGLFLVVNVVRKLGGTVTATNCPEGGAIVTLTLPLAMLSQEDDGG